MSNQFKSGIWHDSPSHGKAHPRGRVLDNDVLEKCQQLLADLPKRHDLLIEYLHRIQDSVGYLPASYLTALAHYLTLSEAQVFQAASFYAHFDVVTENQTPPPPVTVRVCNNLSCCMAGGDELAAALSEQCHHDQVRVERCSCVGLCDKAPVAVVGQRPVTMATCEAVSDVLSQQQFQPDIPTYQGLDAYLAQGGYQQLHALRDGSYRPETLIEAVTRGNIRGLGGAGYPAYKKWHAMEGTPHPKLMVVNGDEGEPGTFKDRHLLESRPHEVLEGMLLTAAVNDVDTLYIYLRDEYPSIRHILKEELSKLRAAGIIAPEQVHLRRGAGAYICGEESALLESLEGKAGLPRNRPPHMTESGLFHRPTLMHNIESLYWIRYVAYHGGEALYRAERRGRHGKRHYSVSGRVKQPGVYCLPVGSNITEVIEAAGGMQDGHIFTAYQPGGPSSGLLPASVDDVPLDFGALASQGTSVGSGAVVILSQQDDLIEAVRNMMAFFRHESCGQCTPCREGCDKALTLIHAAHWDRPLLEDLAEVMVEGSICGLGQAAAVPFRQILRFFPEQVSVYGKQSD